MARWPATISLMRWGGSPISLARRYCEMPIGSRNSCAPVCRASPDNSLHFFDPQIAVTVTNDVHQNSTFTRRRSTKETDGTIVNSCCTDLGGLPLGPRGGFPGEFEGRHAAIAMFACQFRCLIPCRNPPHTVAWNLGCILERDGHKVRNARRDGCQNAPRACSGETRRRTPGHEMQLKSMALAGLTLSSHAGCSVLISIGLPGTTAGLTSGGIPA